MSLGEAMFLSRFTNTLDAKGRVSVPADFRSAVASGDIRHGIKYNDEFDGIVIWPSIDGKWLEGGGMALLRSHQAMLNNLKPHDLARIAFERAVFGESHRLSFDASGRVSLPKELAEFAGLDKQATFVGMGQRFEIWNPDAYDAKVKLVRKMAKETRQRLYAVSQFSTFDQGPGDQGPGNQGSGS